MNPQVSIIIASYNSDKSIRKALNSVLNQTYQDWECIVIDGASKDKTLSIVKEYENFDPRFRHVSEPDHGIYDAFNKGWKLAKGEWIHYLGSDDSLEKDGITVLMKEINDEVGVISGSCWIDKIDGTVVSQPSIGIEGCHQAKITRKSEIEKNGGFDCSYKIFADYDLYVRMKNAGVVFMNIKEEVAHFTMDGTSQKLKNLIRCNNEYRRIFKTNGIRYSIFKQFNYLVRTTLSILYRKGRKVINYCKII